MRGAFARRSKMNEAPAVAPVVPVMGPEWSVAPEAPAPVAFAGKDMNRRPGMFGRLGNALRRVDWERVAAAMRDDPSHMQSLLEQRENAAERMRAEAEAEAQRRAGKQENTERQAALAALPEHLRPLAPFLTPEAISRAVVPDEPEWEIDSRTGRPYTIQGGAIRYGQGSITPAGAGAGERAPPSGYRWTADGSLEAVPGGPADVRATAEGRARADQLGASEQNLNRALAALDQAEPLIGPGSAGVFGSATRDFNQQATDLDAALEPVRAILSFETLAEMRRNSTTGGALGSIAVRELELLGSTYEDLRIARSPAALRQAVRRLRVQLTRTRDAIAAARQEIASLAPAAEGGGQRERTFNPETGRLE